MKIPVARLFGFHELAQNLYHVDVLYPQACLSHSINYQHDQHNTREAQLVQW